MSMEEKKVIKKKKKKKGARTAVILALVLASGVGGAFLWKQKKAAGAAKTNDQVQTAEAAVMDITSELTASSSLSPKDTYEVTSLVEGEVLEALFEEGDVVEKDQVLYRIDASSMDSDLSSAETSLLRARESQQSAQEDYNEAAGTLSGNTYKASVSGYVKTLYIKEGDKVSNGTKLADIYDDSVMKLTVPFLSAEAEQIQVGSPVVLTLEDTGEELQGIVTVVSSMEETLSGGRLVKAVTVEVENPGGLTTLVQAAAAVGEASSCEPGTFVPKTETTLSADLSGQGSLEVENLMVSEGASVDNGTALFKATDQSAAKYLENFKDALETAGDNVKNAENKLENTQDTIGDYTITAPISGTVITKNAKAGDKITKGTSGNTVMAVIYDLSAMTLSMSVDELDVGSVKAGQTVEITADAVEGETFTGTVTNVSLEGSYSNGVTNYPVTVTLEETGDLLPGMNVDATIILDSAQDALCIPAGALMRGNRVYVKKDPSSGQTDQTEGTEDGSEEAARGQSGGSGQGQSGVPDGFEAVQVETGIINDDYVQILSGLSEGDEVYVDPDSGSGTSMDMMMMGPGGMGGGMEGGPGGGGGGMGGGPRP